MFIQCLHDIFCIKVNSQVIFIELIHENVENSKYSLKSLRYTYQYLKNLEIPNTYLNFDSFIINFS